MRKEARQDGSSPIDSFDLSPQFDTIRQRSIRRRTSTIRINWDPLETLCPIRINIIIISIFITLTASNEILIGLIFFGGY